MKRILRLFKSIKSHAGIIVGYVAFTGFLFLLPSPNWYFRPISQTGGFAMSSTILLPSPPFYPLSKEDVSFPEVSSQGLFIKDLDSGVTLYKKNEHTRFPPASTTKIMTAIIALESYPSDMVLTVREVTTEGRTMNLHSGEQLTVESLLYGTLVHSANDAAYTLAENYPGGVANFVSRMNEKAQELHLTNTHFTNPVGFDDPDQYSSAFDLARQAQVALKNSQFSKIVSTRAITVSDVTYTYFHELRNVNELLGKVAGVSGVKTGYTESAGEILISEVRKNDRSVLIVLLKSADRFGETITLIDWVFQTYTWVPFETLIPTIQG